MGNTLWSLLGWHRFVSQRERRVIMVGLDGAGKTTILSNLKSDKVVSTVPTIGFNVESIQHKNLSLTIWDVGGQDIIRPLWRHYYPNTQGIIFIIDSNDKDRLDIARKELYTMLHDNDHKLDNVALLIYANKQDLPDALSFSEIEDELDLKSIKDREWFIQPSCAMTKEGLYDGFEWLSTVISMA